MRRIVWSRAAREDVQRIRAYIGQFNPLAAQRTAVRLTLAADSLADYPERGRIVGANLRELVVVYPYLIRYRMGSSAVSILRIRHGAQRPA